MPDKLQTAVSDQRTEPAMNPHQSTPPGDRNGSISQAFVELAAIGGEGATSWTSHTPWPDGVCGCWMSAVPA